MFVLNWLSWLICIPLFPVAFVYQLVCQSRFKSFLQKIKRNPLFPPLLDELARLKIGLSSLDFYSAFLFERSAGMTANASQRTSRHRILISNWVIKKFLNDQNDYYQIILLSIGHELGHFISSKSLEKIGRKNCTVETKQCLYEEVLATRAGIIRLEKILNKKIGELVSKKNLNVLFFTTCKQCKRCICQKCPRSKELERMEMKLVLRMS